MEIKNKEKILEAMLEAEENKYIKVKIYTVLSKLRKKKNRQYSLIEKMLKVVMLSEK